MQIIRYGDGLGHLLEADLQDLLDEVKTLRTEIEVLRAEVNLMKAA